MEHDFAICSQIPPIKREALTMKVEWPASNHHHGMGWQLPLVQIAHDRASVAVICATEPRKHSTARSKSANVVNTA